MVSAWSEFKYVTALRMQVNGDSRKNIVTGIYVKWLIE